jgi:C1A family cysteine protease
MLIDDDTPEAVTHDPQYSRGLVPRDYATDPPEMFAQPEGMPLIPRSEWDARIAEQDANESSLEHIWRRSGQRSLDQNGQGYCWAYSTGAAVMLTRMAANLPVVRVSPHAVACKIKGFRDEGGWCGLSAKFAREVGYPSVDVWPEKSMSRQNDRPETWADAAKHKIEEDWVDLAAGHFYYQNLTFDQVATCVLLNRACPVDFNWWQHSVCAVGLVRVEPGSYGLRILNSWSENWGEQGFATLRGNKATPNSALCVRTVTT